MIPDNADWQQAAWNAPNSALPMLVLNKIYIHMYVWNDYDDNDGGYDNDDVMVTTTMT